MLGSTFLLLKLQDNGKVSCDITDSYCDISHWLSQLSSYTQLILHLTIDSTDTLQGILSYHHMLESMKIDNCNLSSDVSRTLVHSLQSPHCILRKLALNTCKISTSDETQQNAISTKNNTTLCSLVTTDSLCVLNHILSNVVFTQLTELSLCITTHSSSESEVLANIPVSCSVLESIKIDNDVSLSLPLSITQFIGSKQNNLYILLLSGCYLSSDVTRSLIRSMQSLH